jgi:hypothetical protein
MPRLFINFAASGAALVATAASASAQSHGGRWWSWLQNWRGGWSRGDGPTRSSVPEIDASSGLLALAVIGAALLLAFEIKRRRKAD